MTTPSNCHLFPPYYYIHPSKTYYLCSSLFFEGFRATHHLIREGLTSFFVIALAICSSSVTHSIFICIFSIILLYIPNKFSISYLRSLRMILMHPLMLYCLSLFQYSFSLLALQFCIYQIISSVASIKLKTFAAIFSEANSATKCNGHLFFW